MMSQRIATIDHELPQTQCGLCGEPGCLPYATAIANGAPFNKCVPGGQALTDTLAKLLNKPSISVVASRWPTQSDGRPQRLKAVIREEDCIGCVKCIQACPVDAIIGTGKMMHQVAAELCTGCELCIAPCPVDCIDLIVDPVIPSSTVGYQQQDDLRSRYSARLIRDRVPALASNSGRIHLEPTYQPTLKNTTNPDILHIMQRLNPQDMIEFSQLQVKLKKLNRQLTQPLIQSPNQTILQQQIATIQQRIAILTSHSSTDTKMTSETINED